MKTKDEIYKDKIVRSLAGGLIIFLLILQKVCSIDLSVCIYCVGINLFQYGITGWCPFATYFTKIGWMQSR